MLVSSLGDSNNCIYHAQTAFGTRHVAYPSAMTFMNLYGAAAVAPSELIGLQSSQVAIFW